MTYVLRRVLLMFPTLFGISVLVFALARMGSDPAEEYVRRIHNIPYPSSTDLARARKELGLDRPLVSQYETWLTEATHGHLGESYMSQLPVTMEFTRRIGPTLTLAIPALALSLMLGVPLGILAASQRNRLVDHLLRFACLGGASIPGFWLAILLMQLFAVRLGLLPIVYAQGPVSAVLPILSLAIPISAGLARFTRASMLESMAHDYVRTAHAKGLTSNDVLEKHVLRNALIPLVTVFSGTVAHLLAGTAVIETIFAWPGMGSLAVDAIKQGDYPTIQGVVLYTGVLFVVMNLLVDVVYVLVDPRIRLGGTGPP